MFEVTYKDGSRKSVNREIDVDWLLHQELEPLEPMFEIESVKNLDTGEVRKYSLAYDVNQDEK